MPRTFNLSINTRRRTWRLQHAILKRRLGREVFPDGSRRIDLGPLELAVEPRREAASAD